MRTPPKEIHLSIVHSLRSSGAHSGPGGRGGRELVGGAGAGFVITGVPRP